MPIEAVSRAAAAMYAGRVVAGPFVRKEAPRAAAVSGATAITANAEHGQRRQQRSREGGAGASPGVEGHEGGADHSDPREAQAGAGPDRDALGLPVREHQ